MNNLNEVLGGTLYSSGNIPDQLRKYAQDGDAFRFFALYQKYELSILRIISEKFQHIPSEQITDFEFKYPNRTEAPYTFTPVGATSVDVAANFTSTIVLTNEMASALHQGMILMVSKDSANTSTGSFIDANATTSSTTMTAICYLPETVRVVSIGAEDSASIGNRNVVVRRFYPVEVPTANILPIRNTHLLTIVNNIAAEDSLPYPPTSKNPGQDYNYIQTTRESYGISSHIKAGIKTWADGDPLDLEMEMASARVMREIETALIMGRRSRNRIAGNKMLYQTGGLLEFIPSTNLINFNAVVTPVNFTNQVGVMGLSAGSTVSEFWGFCGSSAMQAVNNAFAQTVGALPLASAESIKYSVSVKEFVNNATNSKVFLVPTPIMDLLGMQDQIIFLNLSDKHKCFQIAEKKPLIDLPEGADSLNSDSGQYSTLRELYTMFGLVRRLPQTHFRWYNIR